MQKIPVLETVGETYGLAFGRYFSILGIVWLPLLLLGGAIYFAFAPIFSQFDWFIHTKDAQGFAANMQALSGRIWLLDILELLFFAVLGVGITREAFGLRKPPKFVYLRLSADELRVFGSFVLLLALVMGFSIVGVLGIVISGAIGAGIVSALAGGGVHLSPQQIGGLGGLLVFAAFMFAFYIGIRLTYFIVPVTVAEHRFGILRSWELTKGNVLRILGVLIATLLPFFVAMLVVEVIAVVPLMMRVVNAAQQHQTPEAVFASLMKALLAYLPYYGVALMLLTPIMYGLMMGAPAFAYRALVPATPAVPAST